MWGSSHFGKLAESGKLKESKKQRKKEKVMNKFLRYGLGVAVPPVGVFMTYGVSPALFVNLPLTLLGWLPGSIHAVWAIAKSYEE